MLSLVDDHKSLGELSDPRGQVAIKVLPAYCSGVHQPVDMGVTAAFKLGYRRRLLDSRADIFYEVIRLPWERK